MTEYEIEIDLKVIIDTENDELQPNINVIHETYGNLDGLLDSDEAETFILENLKDLNHSFFVKGWAVFE